MVAGDTFLPRPLIFIVLHVRFLYMYTVQSICCWRMYNVSYTIISFVAGGIWGPNSGQFLPARKRAGRKVVVFMYVLLKLSSRDK